jgi:mono/diheme cytochrome c family protein
MWVRYVGHAAALAIIGAGTCFAQSAGQQRDPNRIYAITCHYCHDNGIGPALKGANFLPERIRLAVRQGYASMPAFMPSDITDAELAALVQMLSGPAAPTAAAGPR